jgi:hypothetical protein
MNCRMCVWILRRDIDGPLTVLVGCDIFWSMLVEELALFLALMDMPCISRFMFGSFTFVFPHRCCASVGRRVTSYSAIMGKAKCALHNWISKETKYELLFDYAFRSSLVYICSCFSMISCLCFIYYPLWEMRCDACEV